MNVVEFTIRSVDYDMNIGDKPLEKRIPSITEFKDQKTLVYEYGHLQYYVDCFFSFLRTQGWSDEAIVEYIDEWTEDKMKEMGYDNE